MLIIYDGGEEEDTREYFGEDCRLQAAENARIAIGAARHGEAAGGMQLSKSKIEPGERGARDYVSARCAI